MAAPVSVSDAAHGLPDLRARPTAPLPLPDDALRIHASQGAVSWLAGGQVQQTFTVANSAGPVLQAVWASLDDDPDLVTRRSVGGSGNDGDHVGGGGGGPAARRHICVLQAELITLFAPGGDTFLIPLPFLAKAIWPLEQGILIERYVDFCVLGLSQVDRGLIFLCYILPCGLGVSLVWVAGFFLCVLLQATDAQ